MDRPRPSPRPYSSGGESQWESETFSTSRALPRGEGAFPKVVARCLRVESQSCLLSPCQGSAEVPAACPETQGQPWEEPGPGDIGLVAPVCTEEGQV